jgi:hypothetical protein
MPIEKIAVDAGIRGKGQGRQPSTFCSGVYARSSRVCGLDFCRRPVANFSVHGASGDAMDQRVTIARLNIEHYRRKLATEKSEATRHTIMRLLAEEEATLAALNDPPGENKEKG